MTEPDVTLTDYALAVETLLFAYLLMRRTTANDAARNWLAALFLSLTAAAALGGTSHGFFADESSPGYRILWPLTMISIGSAAAAGWGFGAAVMFGARIARMIGLLAGIGLAVYCGVILFVSEDYLVAIVTYLPASLIIMAAFGRAFHRTRARSAVFGVVGIVLTFVAAAVQQAGISIHPTYFNHNALYHVIQGVGLFLVFLGGRGVVGMVAPEGPVEDDSGPGTSKRPGKKWIAAAVVAVLGGGYLLTGEEAADSPATPARSIETRTYIPVKTEPVRRQESYQVRERFSGRVVSQRTSDIGFDRGGILTGVSVDEGDAFAKGDVLATLDKAHIMARRNELAADLRHSHANIEATAARHRLAAATVKRHHKLLASKNISKQRYDEALYEEEALVGELAALSAAVDRIRAQIKTIDVEIIRSSLRAPFSGTVTARFVDEGRALNVGEAVLRIVDNEAMEARIGVPVRVARDLEKGGRYEIEIAGETFAATLRSILDLVDSHTRTVTVILMMEAAQGRVRSGQHALLTLQRQIGQPGFWVPITALTGSRRGLWGIYVLAPVSNDRKVMRLERRELQLVHSEADRAFVRGTIEDGDRVVVTGLHRIVPGQLVLAE